MDARTEFISIDLRDRDKATERLSEVHETKNAERIRIRFLNDRGWIHVGGLAYRERETIHRIDDSSLVDASRNDIIIGVVDSYCTPYLNGGSEYTAHHEMFRGLRFYDWVDANGYYFFFEDEAKAVSVLTTYFKMIENMVYSEGTLSSQAGSSKQRTAYTAFLAVHEASQVNFAQLDPIEYQRSTPTEAADEQDVRYNFMVSRAIFEQLAEWRMRDGKFPFQVNLPKEPVWIVVSRTWSMPSWIAQDRAVRANGNWMWDYDNGQVNSLDFIMEAYGYRHSDAVKQIGRAEGYTRLANKDDRYWLRSVIYNLCCRAFGYLFAAFTVMNPQQISSQRWGDDWVVEPVSNVDGVKFINIKSRAGRFVSFKMSKAAMPLFKVFLQFRSAVLLSRPEHDYLFFQINKFGAVGQMPADFLQIYYIQVADRLDNDIKSISIRKIRVLKAGVISEKYSPADAASSLQNAVGTVDINYSSGNAGVQSLEFTDYFKSFNAVVFGSESQPSHAIDSGGCISFGSPEPILAYSELKLSCGKPEGCLGCKHYRLHADGDDLRKVLSAKYVIQMMGEYLAESAEYKAIFIPIIDAIDFLVETVRSHSSDHSALVVEVSELVDDGYLTDYWEGKLQFLIDLGVVS